LAERKKRQSITTRWNKLNKSVEACQLCPRLIDHCAEVARVKRKAYLDHKYWGGPVANFGDSKARLLVVGLAPGAHGANRTGRMFTGDRSGDWLYRALHNAGFANQPKSADLRDGLKLNDCVITNACHCAPPDNKPTREEVQNCRVWFDQTFDLLPVRVIVALGQIAWRNVVGFAKDRGLHQGPIPKFGHAAECEFQSEDQSTLLTLIGSFHPSQQNTFTGRLTEHMLDNVFDRARTLLQT
jgi:uracil-DNA glycosylase family 4